MSDNGFIKIFIVEDDVMFAKLMMMKLEENSKYEVTHFASGAAMFEEIEANPDIMVLDYFLPDKSGLEIINELNKQNRDVACILLSGQQDVEVVVESYKAGIRNYIVKNENSLVELNNCIKNISDTIQLQKTLYQLQEQIIDRNKYSNVIGESESMQKVFRLLNKIENSDVLTLITGESGTGKEVIANTIHYNSKRKRNSFVAINVAAIPEDLIESELFGYEKGAFTGASGRRIGKFEEANHGTIFLDEIGEIDLNVQKKLLRVLQERKVCRLGSNKEIDLDVRVIAATNQGLNELVKEKKFREDLYYRLQGFLIHLPPLRDREQDVLLLARHYLEDIAKKQHQPVKVFSTDSLKEMLNYPWPGNVRELKSVVERAYLISDSEKIELEDLVFPASIV